MPAVYVFPFYVDFHYSNCDVATLYGEEECLRLSYWELLNDNTDVPGYPVGVGKSPTPRAALFWGALEHFSSAARAMGPGEVMIPWIGVVFDEFPCFKVSEPPQEDIDALVQHVRLRGAKGYVSFSEYEAEDEDVRQAMLAAWLAVGPVFTTPVVATLNTHKKFGIEVSGVFHDTDKFTVVLSNLRNEEVFITLPNAGGLPTGEFVDALNHEVHTYTVSADPTTAKWPIRRLGDVNMDGEVDIDDTTLVVFGWGACDTENCDPCYADLDGDGDVDEEDLDIVDENLDE